MKRRAFMAAAAGLAAVLAWPGPADGGLEGVVRDQRGTPIAGVTVKAQHTVRHQTSAATTNANGEYLIEPLAPGSYGLYIARKGYCSVWIRQVTVGAGQRTRKDVVLPPDDPCPVP